MSDDGVIPVESIDKILSDHDPSFSIDGIDMFGNIECPCGWKCWEDMHHPKAEAEHRWHVAQVLQEAFQDGRLFSPEFKQVFQGIVEAYRSGPPPS